MAMRIPAEPAQPMRTADASYSIEVVHDGWRMCADTPEELIGMLIDGHADQADEQARLQARLKLALRTRTMVQTLLNAGELFDQGTEEEAQILLNRSDAPPAVAGWQSPIPLVLIASFYQPIGDLPQPRTSAPGQIWWIDPSTAQSLLETLHQVRWLDLTMVEISAARETEEKTYRNLGTNGVAGYRWRDVHTRAVM